MLCAGEDDPQHQEVMMTPSFRHPEIVGHIKNYSCLRYPTDLADVVS